MNTLAFFCFCTPTSFWRQDPAQTPPLFPHWKDQTVFHSTFLPLSVEWQKFTHRSWIRLRSTLFCLDLFCRHICPISSSRAECRPGFLLCFVRFCWVLLFFLVLLWDQGNLTKEDVVWLVGPTNNLLSSNATRNADHDIGSCADAANDEENQRRLRIFFWQSVHLATLNL